MINPNVRKADLEKSKKFYGVNDMSIILRFDARYLGNCQVPTTVQIERYKASKGDR